MTGPDPHRAQRVAADPGASVWVGASAGTGKTKVLTDRVLALMLAGSDPGRILCLTFTKAAAAEMANRLNQRLALWAVAPDGALAEDLVSILGRMPDTALMEHARRLFARVLDAPGGMKIETLHAFCQSLLRRFPLEAGVAPHFDVMDERTAAEALADARDAMLTRARLGDDAPLALALAEVTTHAAETTFDTLIATLVAERARLGRAVAAESMAPIRARLAAALGIAPDETPERIVAAACVSWPAEDALRAAARRMCDSDSVHDSGRGAAMADFLAAPPDQRSSLFDCWCDVFFTKDGAERARIATKAVAEGAPDIEAALRAEVQRLVPVREARSAAYLLRTTLALTALGAAMLGLYRSHKEGRALLDFDDLVFAARDLLCGKGVPPWVLFKLDGGIDHILIDEAQDTNPEQWQVVQKLADEFFVGLSQATRQRTVFAVGDPKQSIFSFQRADPAWFADMRDYFEGRARDASAGWERVPLDLSFRSTACVLAAVDAVFARSPARDGVAEGPGHIIRHDVHRAGMGGVVELWPPVGPGEPPPAMPWELPLVQRRASEPAVRLAQAIAETVRRWLADGERLAARGRRITAGDVLVLVRRRSPFVTALVRALKERDVDVAGSDRMRLVEQLAVEDMMALLQVLLLPEDDLTLATVLKGPLFGFDEDRLFRLAHGRGTDVRLWNELRRRAGEDADFARAADLLQELLARVDYAPPFELIAEILGARGGRRMWLARLGPEAGDPLDELLAAALAYERRHGASLQGFLHWLGSGEIEVKRDLDQRARDEVRIMTVHGAKGLQAPIVFLPDTMGVPPPAPPSVLWTEDGLPLWRAHEGCGGAVFEAARADAQQKKAEEYRRLLYVAMTRAEDRLYLCGWHGKNAPPADSWYELAAAGLKAAPGVEEFVFTAPVADGWKGRGLRLVSPQTARPIDDDHAIAARPGPLALPDWYRSAPKPEPSPPKPLAPSRPDRVEPAPRSPLGDDGGMGFRRGLVVHRLLQTLPQLEPAAREQAARRFLARPVHDLPPEVQEALVAETLAVFDDPETAPLFGPGSLAEVPVVGVLEGRVLSGRIDRLLVTADDVLIVDYKTLRPVPPDEDKVPALYIDQLRAYRAAIAQIYPGRRVRCALLWTDGPTLMPVSESRLAPSVSRPGASRH